MPLETATYVSQLVASNPAHTDAVSVADSHIRLVKAAMLATFPNFTAAALNSTQAQLDAAAAAIATGQFTAQVGSAAAPPFTYGADTHTGWYSFGLSEQRASCASADVVAIRPAGLDILGGASKLLLGGVAAFPLQAANLGANQVLTAGILDKNVTYGKIQDMATGKLHGRSTAGSGSVEELSVGAGLSLAAGTLSSTTVPIPSFAADLSIKVATNTTATVAVSLVTMTDGAGAFRTTPISSTLNLGVAGAVNSLDTGSIAIDSFYHVWGISNGSVDGVLGSLSATAPTMPSGYTLKVYLGAIQTIHASATLYGTWQRNRNVQYIVGLAQTTELPVIESGAKGNYSSTAPTWSTPSVVRFVPPNAIRIGIASCLNYKNGTLASVSIAPSNTYSGDASASGLSPLYDSSGGSPSNVVTWFSLEGATVAWASSQAGGAIRCLGWDF